MWQLLDELRDSGLKPDVFTFASCITGCASCLVAGLLHAVNDRRALHTWCTEHMFYLRSNFVH